MLKNLKKLVPAATMPLLIGSTTPSLLSLVYSHFESQGYPLTAATNVDEVWECIRDGQCEAIILDESLTDDTGIPLYTLLRVKNVTKPIILLIPEEKVQDLPRHLNNGADAVVTMPIHLLELEARVLACLRLSRAYLSQTHLSMYGLELDLLTHTATADGKDLALPPMLFSLLARLMKDAPNLVRYAEVEKLLYGSKTPESSVIRTLICNLRKKLNEHGKLTLETVPRLGYRLVKKS
jgi:DNA-binding response OmpR family regulator